MLYGSVEIPFSDEEIAQHRAETGGCSLEEIWKRWAEREMDGDLPTSAENRFSEYLVESGGSSAVADAVDEIDRLLATEPFDSSESRNGSTRIIIDAH